MRRFISRCCLFAAVVTASLLMNSAVRADENVADEVVLSDDSGHVCDGCSNCFPRPGRNPDLFYNYYLPPGCGTVGSSLYMAPGPVPQHVGHTYVTYQPFMPHEFLYPHHRSYYQYYDGGRGLTRTDIKYYNPPLKRVGQVLSYFKLAR